MIKCHYGRVCAYPALLRAALNELPPILPPLRAASAGDAVTAPSACGPRMCHQPYAETT